MLLAMMIVMPNIYGYLRVFLLVEMACDAFIALLYHRCFVKRNCLSLRLHVWVIETAVAVMKGCLLMRAAFADWVYSLVEICRSVLRGSDQLIELLVQVTVLCFTANRVLHVLVLVMADRESLVPALLPRVLSNCRRIEELCTIFDLIMLALRG